MDISIDVFFHFIDVDALVSDNHVALGQVKTNAQPLLAFSEHESVRLQSQGLFLYRSVIMGNPVFIVVDLEANVFILLKIDLHFHEVGNVSVAD